MHFFFLINYQIFLCFCIFGNITFLFLQWTQLIFTPNGQLLVHRIQNHWKWKKWVLTEQLHLCPYFWNTWYTFTRAGKESQVKPKLWEWFFGIYLWKYSMNIIHPLKSWNCAMWACWEIGVFHFSPIFTNSGIFCVFSEKSEKEINNIVIPDICHMHHMRCRCKKFQPGVKILWIGEKIWIFWFFVIKRSGIGVFLVSAKNGAGVNKMTNITYEHSMDHY